MPVQSKLDDIEQRSGFLRVYRALIDAKKPIVGHNCTYDILFMLANFEGALPETLAQFKARMQDIMPKVTALSDPNVGPRLLCFTPARTAQLMLLALTLPMPSLHLFTHLRVRAHRT
jgi:hypothetical protein